MLAVWFSTTCSFLFFKILLRFSCDIDTETFSIRFSKETIRFDRKLIRIRLNFWLNRVVLCVVWRCYARAAKLFNFEKPIPHAPHIHRRQLWRLQHHSYWFVLIAMPIIATKQHRYYYCADNHTRRSTTSEPQTLSTTLLTLLARNSLRLRMSQTMCGRGAEQLSASTGRSNIDSLA
jgi:hypothetical protein